MHTSSDTMDARGAWNAVEKLAHGGLDLQDAAAQLARDLAEVLRHPTVRDAILRVSDEQGLRGGVLLAEEAAERALADLAVREDRKRAHDDAWNRMYDEQTAEIRARNEARIREEHPDATDDEIAYYLDTAERSIG